MNRSDIYRCPHCGRVVYVVEAGHGGLTCCGHEMQVLKGGEIDGSTEKHVPVIEKIDTGYKVTVGSVAHPMTQEHYISFIELIVDGNHYSQMLQPVASPEAIFNVAHGKSVVAREYCNLHGLWQATLS
ncbi:desulfoferrodoxin [Entomospira culicis]|uniref:Desulfoferrodoxin n=1 Tax=Entomospira culicis TaxID=2719989 RepID=A0A968GEU2_9SPIO|nr:desulfoferrodoxin [Entomospira culicis]NIZ19019.1 desulfoferrodoxin [Entomospira culicis]NIZ69234.1 desulfoferrodoxin [Entomospira culicis]WDI37818.1 desulfoferrodoxin [Entomospira culicis]WDI39446.1 desulfoferrodoxin [Entomospira culicis]